MLVPQRGIFIGDLGKGKKKVRTKNTGASPGALRESKWLVLFFTPQVHLRWPTLLFNLEVFRRSSLTLDENGHFFLKS